LHTAHTKWIVLFLSKCLEKTPMATKTFQFFGDVFFDPLVYENAFYLRWMLFEEKYALGYSTET
jgi:hypothetical protein